MTRMFPALAAILAAVLVTTGCSSVAVSTQQELADFDHVSLHAPDPAAGAGVTTTAPAGPYKAAPGDVLCLKISTCGSTDLSPWKNDFLARVGPAGQIDLPLLGGMAVAGQPMGQIEAAVANAYCPKYITCKPSVVATVWEYGTTKLSITGAVRQAGVYELRSNERLLSLLLAKAGGIVAEGASGVSVIKQGGEIVQMPLRNGTLLARDIALEEGDRVEVQQLSPPRLMIVGLVIKPGIYDWPRDGSLNTMQAVSMAGGTDDFASPRYMTVYRLDHKGEIHKVVIEITGSAAYSESCVALKPGDVVSIESTPQTRARVFLLNLFRNSIGGSVGAFYNLNPAKQ